MFSTTALHALRPVFVLVVVAAIVALAFQAAAAENGDSSKLTLWKDGDPGERLLINGRITDSQKRPVVGAQIHVRQADGSGTYTAGYSASMLSGKDGSFELRTALPGQYGPAKHIHVKIAHDAYQPVYTEIRFKTDPSDNDDPTEILLEEAQVGGRTVYVGRFDVVLRK